MLVQAVPNRRWTPESTVLLNIRSQSRFQEPGHITIFRRRGGHQLATSMLINSLPRGLKQQKDSWGDWTSDIEASVGAKTSVTLASYQDEEGIIVTRNCRRVQVLTVSSCGWAP